MDSVINNLEQKSTAALYGETGTSLRPIGLRYDELPEEVRTTLLERQMEKRIHGNRAGFRKILQPILYDGLGKAGIKYDFRRARVWEVNPGSPIISFDVKTKSTVFSGPFNWLNDGITYCVDIINRKYLYQNSMSRFSNYEDIGKGIAFNITRLNESDIVNRKTIRKFAGIYRNICKQLTRCSLSYLKSSIDERRLADMLRNFPGGQSRRYNIDGTPVGLI